MKRFLTNNNKSDEVLSKAIEQVHIQAAFAFNSLFKGEHHYYAFIIALNCFSLLCYICPDMVDQTDASTFRSSNNQAGLSSNTSEMPPISDTPEVIYWNQPVFALQMMKFSVVFLEALHCTTEHLQMESQLFWFDCWTGLNAMEKSLCKDKVCPASFWVSLCSTLTTCY